MFKKQSIAFKLALFMIFLTSLLIMYFSYFIIIPAQKESLYSNLYTRAKTTALLSKPLFNKALELKDDLLLFSQIESITDLDEVTSAYILDKSGSIIMHNNTAEWTKTYTDPLNKKALSTQKPLMQEIEKSNFLLFSSPITSSLTLCIKLSKQRIEQTLLQTKKNTFYTLCIMFVIIIFFVLLFVKTQVTNHFSSFKKILNSVILGKGSIIKIKTRNEFAGLAELINNIINKYSSEEQESKKRIIKIKNNASKLLEQTANHYVNHGLIVFDEQNKLLSISEKARLFLKICESELEDKHILDIAGLKNLIAPIKESLKQPNTIYNSSIDNYNIQILPLFDTEKHISTIISINV
ncbi:hypothetical protein ACFL4O_01555 [bacterium]